MNPTDLRRADAIEIVIGQGAKPGGGGMLLGQKISDRVAEMRDLPAGIDQRSACRHPDWTGPDDLRDQDRRAARDHRLGEADLRQGRRLAAVLRRGAGGQGGRRRRSYSTACRAAPRPRQEVFIEHVGIPILAAITPAVSALQDLGVHREVQLDRLGRDPQRRRRGQGAGARRRRRVDRRRRAHRARRQRAPSTRRTTARSVPRRASTTTGTRAATRPGSARRTSGWPRAWTPRRAPGGWPTT